MSWLDLSAYYIMAGAASDRLEALARPVKTDVPRRIDRVIDYFGGDGRTTTTRAARAPWRGHARVSPHAVTGTARARGGQRWRESRAATNAAEKTKTTAE
jgi:hypothetical protein